MGDHNSLEVYTSLFKRLVSDIAYLHIKSEFSLDWVKIQSRLNREGISFLTKSLPRLGKAFDRALQGDIPFLFPGFEKKLGSTVPKMFGWLFEQVIADSGYVRSDANVVAIKHTRQILYFLYKLELPYDSKTSKKVLDSFIGTEEELKTLQIDPDDAVIKCARTLVARILAGTNARDILPKHGPGAVATGEKGEQKLTFSRIYRSLEEQYPFTGYFQVGLSQTVDQLDRLETLTVLDTGTAKVVLVPKDSRGPRLISCEPLEYQWIQQGLQRKLYSIVENHRLTKGHVNFTDQEVNRALAMRGSLDGSVVTLDMKDASDRVSLQLVECLFSGTEWLQGLKACRTAETRLPDGRIVQQSKFAPMGSAVCFPIEALCFYALAVAVLVVHSQKKWRVALSSIYVYGDDIICDSEDYAVIMQHMELYGLRFNRDKCCVSGFFRESCGCDAYKGVDVTPIRLRKTWNHRRTRDATCLVSYVAFSNALYVRGYRGSAQYVQTLVEGLYGRLPVLEYNSTEMVLSQGLFSPPGRIIGWNRPDVNPIACNLQNGIRYRWNATLHRDEVAGYISKPVYEEWRTDGWEACLYSLCCGSTGLPGGMHAIARRSCLQRSWGISNTGDYFNFPKG